MDVNYRKITVSISKFEDIFELAPNLRAADRLELAAQNITPLSALLYGYVYSDECLTAMYKNKVIAMFGVSAHGMPSGYATVWFLGSDEMFNHPITFLKEGRKYIEKFSDKYDVLINAVDKRNTAHINWICKTGMKLSNPMFINGYEFIQFYKIKRKGGKNV